MVVRRSDPIQAPGELMWGKGDMDLLLRKQAALNMFGEWSDPMVIWDEEKPVVRGHGGTLLRQELQDTVKCSATQVFNRLPQQGIAQQVFDVMPHKDVIWDNDLLHDAESHGGLLQQGAGFCESLNDHESIMSNLFVQNSTTFPMEADIVDRDELLQGVASHDSVLKLSAHGEWPVDVANKPNAELVPFKVPMVTKDWEEALFGGMHYTDVIWDDEKQHLFEHHGLLKQLAQGGNHFVGEEKKLTAEPPTYDVLTHVMTSSADAQEVFASISVTNGLSSFLEHSVANTDQMSSEIPNEVVWDEDVPFNLVSCVIDQNVERHTGQDNMLLGEASMNEFALDSGASFPLQFDRDTIMWDEEMLHNANSHAGLLQKLASGSSDLDTPNDLDTPELHINSDLLQQLAQGGEDLMPHMDVIWDEELLQGPTTYNGLLQNVSQSGEYLIAKERKPSINVKINGKLSCVDGPSFISDLGIDVVHEYFQVLPNIVGYANKMENLPEEIILVLYIDALLDGKVAGLSLFQDSDTKVADIISISYVFSWGNIFPLRNTVNVKAGSLINQKVQNYYDPAHFGTLVRQHDAIIVGHQPKLGMDVVDTMFDETPPEMFVWATGFLVDVGSAHGLLNEMLYQDLLWDNELHGIHDIDGLLQQLDPKLDDLMLGKLLSEEVICDSMLWEEIQAEIGTHHGLLQQLAQSGEFFYEKLIGSERAVFKDLRQKVQQLEYLVNEVQFKLACSLSHLGSMCNTPAKPSIFLIGGYSVVTCWLSSLDSFSPEKDLAVSLTPIIFLCSYVSAAVVAGEVFAFGGDDSMSWYNTLFS